jgi:hypothetical protein
MARRPVYVPSLRGVSRDSPVRKAYGKARAIAAKDYPHVIGGGHRRLGWPSRIDGVTGYDCSGAVCASLHAAGLIDSVVLAQDLVRWGTRGTGKHMTVWAKNMGDGKGHCLMEFTLPDGTVYFEFRRVGTTGGFLRYRNTSGFRPRHWEGT